MLKSVYSGAVRLCPLNSNRMAGIFFSSHKRCNSIDVIQQKWNKKCFYAAFFMYPCNHNTQQKILTIMNMNTDSTVFWGGDLFTFFFTCSDFFLYLSWFMFWVFGFHLFELRFFFLSSFAFTSFMIIYFIIKEKMHPNDFFSIQKKKRQTQSQNHKSTIFGCRK